MWNERYQSGQKAIVFYRSEVSGATLGYDCTIVRLRKSSVRRWPDRPDRWIYRIFVPHFDSHMDVLPCDLVVTPESAETTTAGGEGKGAISEIWLEPALADDNDEIRGKYRASGHDWQDFVFRKYNQPNARHQFSTPMAGSTLNTDSHWHNILWYYVPMMECLDRAYVLDKLAELTGVQSWRSIN